MAHGPAELSELRREWVAGVGASACGMTVERRARWAMITVGLAIWLVAIAWPGWSLPGLLLGAMTVAWATFGLLTE